MKVVHSLWFSKVRYGIQLWATTRTKNEDKTNTMMKKMQVTQNRLLRLLEGCRIKDHRSVESMLTSQKLPSINQLAIEVKILETWKAINIEGYPTAMYPMKSDSQNANSDRVLRESSIRALKDNAKTEVGERSFCINAAKIWNNIPNDIKCAKTLKQAKLLTKIYCKSMPI